MGKKKKNRRVVLLLAGVVAVALVVVAVLEMTNTADILPTNSKKTSTPPESTINYGPPTEEEQQSGDDKKDEIISQNESSEQAPASVSVVIADAAQYGNNIEVRALATNIVKDGTCTISFTKDSHTIEKQVPATADAKTTLCKNLSVPRAEFPASGKWNVAVTYTSGDRTGKAEASVEVK